MLKHGFYKMRCDNHNGGKSRVICNCSVYLTPLRDKYILVGEHDCDRAKDVVLLEDGSNEDLAMNGDGTQLLFQVEEVKP